MNLDKYNDNRLEKEQISKEEFCDGYENFKIGLFIKEARVKNGLS